jgi:hypothetical protein
MIAVTATARRCVDLSKLSDPERQIVAAMIQADQAARAAKTATPAREAAA